MTAPTADTWCRRCFGINSIWSAPSPLWNYVMRNGSINGSELFEGIICIGCFVELAEAMGVAGMWRLDAVDVYVDLETVTPSGRVWNPSTWRWDVGEERHREGTTEAAASAGSNGEAPLGESSASIPQS